MDSTALYRWTRCAGSNGCVCSEFDPSNVSGGQLGLHFEGALSST